MANLTNLMEAAVKNYVTRGEQPPTLTGPMRVQLLSALGTNDAAGTPVSGAIVAYGATQATAGGGPNGNAAVLRWEGLPNPTTVAGYRIIDSAGTPVVTLDNIARVGGPVVVDGGVFEVAVGQLTTDAD